MKRLVLLLILICSTLGAYSQDFGVEEEKKQEEVIEEEFEEFFDPYKLTFRVRPLSFFLFPLTQGRFGSFNGRVDYAVSRDVAFAIEANYFYSRPIPTSDFRADLFSIRLDGNYFIMQKENRQRYGEGFHVGVYYKFRYEDSFGTSNVQAYGQSRIISGSHIFGPIFGFQRVNNRFVIDQHFGFGLGVASSNVGLLLQPDIRLGLSIGTVVIK